MSENYTPINISNVSGYEPQNIGNKISKKMLFGGIVAVLFVVTGIVAVNQRQTQNTEAQTAVTDACPPGTQLSYLTTDACAASGGTVSNTDVGGDEMPVGNVPCCVPVIPVTPIECPPGSIKIERSATDNGLCPGNVEPIQIIEGENGVVWLCCPQGQEVTPVDPTLTPSPTPEECVYPQRPNITIAVTCPTCE